MRQSCVVLAEGQQSLLRSIKNLLEPRIEVAAMTDNVISLIDSIRSLDPDIAIDALSARTVLAYFTAVAARRLEASIEVVASQGEFTITAAPAMDV